jgi:DNA-binding CsgD family transcriptional regulator
MQGDIWLSRPIVEKLISITSAPPGSSKVSSLSQREQEVLRLVAGGKTNQEIGARLGIGEKTVEKHLKNVFVKLGVVSRVEAAVQAVQAGIM